MKKLIRSRIFLASIIVGAFYSIATDKWIFDHFRWKPSNISFLTYTYQNLLIPSLIFLSLGSSLSYVYLQLFRQITSEWPTVLKLVTFGVSVFLFYLFVIVSAEGYYWAIAFFNR